MVTAHVIKGSNKLTIPMTMTMALFISSPQLHGHTLEGGRFQTLRYQVGYFPKLLPSLTAEWLEHLIPVPGVMGSNPAVSGSRVIFGEGLLSVWILTVSFKDNGIRKD